jgi:hypothetical protein
MRVRGWPAVTMVRGRIVMQRGRLLAEKGWGEYVERNLLPEGLYDKEVGR